MKKILFGLLAVSAISFAAAPDLTRQPSVGGYLFSNAMPGAIPVKGNLTSTPQIVKYVIFAGTSDSAAAGETELQLTDFILSQKEGVVGFKGVNPTVYVKKVSDLNAEEALTNETIKFRLSLSTPVTSVIGTGNTSNWMNEGDTLDIHPFALAARADLEKIISDKGWDSNTHINAMGTLATKDNDENRYMLPKVIRIAQPTKGQFTFETVVDSRYATNNKKYSAGTCAEIDELFKIAKPLDSGVKVEVEIG